VKEDGKNEVFWDERRRRRIWVREDNVNKGK